MIEMEPEYKEVPVILPSKATHGLHAYYPTIGHLSVSPDWSDEEIQRYRDGFLEGYELRMRHEANGK